MEDDVHSTQRSKPAEDPPPSPSNCRSASQVKKADLSRSGTEPPDSGWAWVVLLGNFFVVLSSLGYVIALSVFFVSWRTEFEATAAAAGLVVSTGAFTRGLASPVVGALFTKFSGRTVMITGGLISSLGILLTSFGTSIPYLIGTTGILAAIGFSCTFNAVYVMLRLYFKKRYSLAVGLTLSGANAGLLILPPLYTWLINGYGWRGAMLIIAAINLNLLVAGALMRPVRAKKVSPKKTKTDLEGDHAKISGATENSQSFVETEKSLGGTHVEGDKVKHAGEVIEDLQSVGLRGSCSSDAVVEKAQSASSKLDGSTSDVEENVEEHFGARVTVTALDSRFSIVTRHIHRFRTFLLDTYGLRRLSHNVRFVLVCFVAFTTAYSFASLGIHLIPMAHYAGISSEAASLLLSIRGGVGLVCQPLGGWLVDAGYVSAEILYTASLSAQAVASCLIPKLTTSFGWLAALTVVLGVGGGIAGSLIMVLLHNATRPAEAAAATGILIFCWGIGVLSGGVFAGFLYDVTGIYDFSFYCAGIVSMVAAALSLIIHFVRKAKARRQGTTTAPLAAASLDNQGFVTDDVQAPAYKTSTTETDVDTKLLNDNQSRWSKCAQIDSFYSQVSEVEVHKDGNLKVDDAAESNCGNAASILDERGRVKSYNGSADEGANEIRASGTSGSFGKLSYTEEVWI